jgi:hypothetical protein
VVTLGRSKLAAPVLAQAAAFVVVLVIGGFTGHSSSPPGPVTTPSPSSSATSSATSSASAPAKGQGAKLTVTVTPEGTDGVSVAGSKTEILQSTTLRTVASGTLDPALKFVATLPAGAYQACVKPPADWTSALKDTHVINGYICGPADVGSAPTSVTFPLAPVPQAGR